MYDDFGGDNAILGLFHFQFCLVKLGLRVGAFLDGGELLLIFGEEHEVAGELFIRRQVRVEVATQDNPVFGQAIMKQEEMSPELFNLDGIHCAFRAEMHTDEDVLIGHRNRQFASPFQQLFPTDLIFNLFDDVVKRPQLFEGKFVDDDQRVLTGIDYHMDKCFLVYGRKKSL